MLGRLRKNRDVESLLGCDDTNSIDRGTCWKVRWYPTSGSWTNKRRCVDVPSLFATRQYTVLDGDDVHAQTGRRVVSGLHQHIRGADHAVDWQVRSKMVGQVGWPVDIATERAQHADEMPIRMAIPLETNEVEGDTNFLIGFDFQGLLRVRVDVMAHVCHRTPLSGTWQEVKIAHTAGSGLLCTRRVRSTKQ